MLLPDFCRLIWCQFKLIPWNDFNETWIIFQVIYLNPPEIEIQCNDLSCFSESRYDTLWTCNSLLPLLLLHLILHWLLVKLIGAPIDGLFGWFTFLLSWDRKVAVDPKLAFMTTYFCLLRLPSHVWWEIAFYLILLSAHSATLCHATYSFTCEIHFQPFLLQCYFRVHSVTIDIFNFIRQITFYGTQ